MESKLHVSVGLALLTWVFAGVAWLVAHIAIIAGIAALIASIISAWAGIETARLRREERRQLKHSNHPGPRWKWHR